jgi:hypothetical protein
MLSNVYAESVLIVYAVGRKYERTEVKKKKKKKIQF